MAGLLVARDLPGEEGTTLADRWADAPVVRRRALPVAEPWCQTCGGRRRVCDHRPRRVFPRSGPVHGVCKLGHGPDRVCPAHPQPRSPEAATARAMPWGVLGWDGVCGLGQRRCTRPWAVGQLRTARADTDPLCVSDDALARAMPRDQPRRAARPPDPQPLAAA